jgi:type IV fimbrial biogenesis protein FimT
MFHQHGTTLPELLASLAVITIVAGAALPSVTRIVQRSESTASINWIVAAVNYTRNSAISHGQMVTLCPADGDHCGGKWHNGMLIFADEDHDGKFGSRDRIIGRVGPLPGGGTITFRAFRRRQYLQITPMGHTNYQNGDFVYCSADQDPLYARQLVVNVQGRARVVRTRDEDGNVVDRRGRLLRC